MSSREIVLRIVLPRWTRLHGGLLVIILVGAGGLAAWAKWPIEPPKKDDPLSAAYFKSMLDGIEETRAALDARVAALEKQGLDGRVKALEDRAPNFCGSTNMPFNGKDVGGYANAKRTCGMLCGTQRGHMCTTEDMMTIAATGKKMPTGWYASGVMGQGYRTMNGSIVQETIFGDCWAYTALDSGNGSKLTGGLWDTSLQVPTWAWCESVYPILCCD